MENFFKQKGAKPGLEKAVFEFVELLNDRAEKQESRVEYFWESMRKRIRVYISYHGVASVYCFIDLDGNILFPATWNRPAQSKPVRGNIFSDDPLKGSTIYSVKYLR